MRWIRDPTMYLAVPRRGAQGTPFTRLESQHVRRMLEVGTIAEVRPCDVRGWLNVFGVVEWSKKRVRSIKEPRDINDYLGKETLLKIDMATKETIVRAVHDGDYFVQFDFASYYDQFEMNEEISKLQCFKKGRKYYRQVTAPMGQRQMVEVAHTATRKLTDFAGRECKTQAIIDNVIFVGGVEGDPSPLVRDARQFVERVREVNGKLNDETEDLASLVQQSGDWGGVHLDLRARTVRVTQKVLDKIKESLDNRGLWTNRNLMAHYGLLFWAVGLTPVCPGDYFEALKFYAVLCNRFTTGVYPEYYYEEQAQVPDNVGRALARWTNEVLKNVPRVVEKLNLSSGAQPDWLVCVDASRYGWGYVAYDPNSGVVRAGGGKWDRDFARENYEKLRRSVFTEPHAVVRAMCDLLKRTGTKQRVRVWTDNVTTKCANNKGFSAASEDVNSAARRLRHYFPPDEFEFQFEYIKGTDNVFADGISRGKTEDETDYEGVPALFNMLEVERQQQQQ